MSPNDLTQALTPTPTGVRLKLHIQPGAKKNEIVGLHDGALKIKIKAPPEDGKANKELRAYLAKLLGTPQNTISIDSGESSRKKTLSIAGLTIESAIARILAS